MTSCWRHNVAHGGLQALAALSEYPHEATLGRPQRERVSKVKQYIEEIASPWSGAYRSDVVRHAVGQGLDTEAVENTIDSLLESGVIYNDGGYV